MATLTKKQKRANAALIKAIAGQPPQKKKRKRTRRPRTTVVVQQPLRNGQGRKPGRKRNRGGRFSMITTAGNEKQFVVPVDEQIAIFLGSTGYNTTAYSINPGNPLCFPFLSRVAQNYERYEFEQLMFHYRPSASVFANVGAQGFVGISATMDATQSAPSSQAQAEIMKHSPVVETAVPTTIVLDRKFLESDSPRQLRFVRDNGLIPPGTDPHTYDCGQVFFWTNGQANTNQIGELRVVGKCRLSNPVLDISANAPPNFNISQWNQPSVSGPANGSGLTIPFSQNVLNCGITNTAGTFTIPVGNWLIDLDVTSTQSAIGTTNYLSTTASLLLNGATLADPMAQVSIGNTLILCATSMHCSWAIASNGAATVQGQLTSFFGAGSPTYTAAIRFTAL